MWRRLLSKLPWSQTPPTPPPSPVVSADTDHVFVDHPQLFVPFHAYRIAGPYKQSSTDERRHITAAINHPATTSAFNTVLACELAAYPDYRNWLAAAVQQFLEETPATIATIGQIVLMAPNWVGVFDILGAPADSDTVIICEPPHLPPSPADSDDDP